MNRKIITIAAGFAVIALAGWPGCAAHQAPAHSAAAVCRNFNNWYHIQPGTNGAPDEFAGTLASAVSQAPSGLLRTDLDMLKADLTRARALRGSAAGQTADSYVSTDEAVVAGICNPS
jgi:hypothetical protein